MSNLTKYFGTPAINNMFPEWGNWDRFDEYLFNNDPWTTGLAHRPTNKYRWDETEDEYKLDIVMPGMTKKDIDLTFKDGTLTIKCKKDVSEGDQKFLGVKTEQAFRDFPRAVNAEKVSAEMNEGVLSIILPKKESDKAKCIVIK